VIRDYHTDEPGKPRARVEERRPRARISQAAGERERKRNARGGELHSLEELLQIDGIGQGTIDKIRPYIVFGPPKRN